MVFRAIPLSLIDENPFNARLRYDTDEITRLSVSMSNSGLLSPIMVRKKAGSKRYELVFGHRRAKAARLLGWASIRAEVKTFSDEEMLVNSMSENLARENLSDYEKAKCFHNFKMRFSKTNAEIGQVIGYSEAHVNNYLRMLQLIDESMTEEDLSYYLHQISEHHARILLRIPSQEERIRALKLAVTEKMSVRDLQRMIRDLHGWFSENSEASGDEEQFVRRKSTAQYLEQSKEEELSRIEKTLKAEFRFPHIGDFEKFIRMCAFDMGFSYFSSFPPYARYDNREAIERKRNWFFKEGPHTSNIKDIRIQFYDNTAVATLMVERKDDSAYGNKDVIPIRGSLVLIRDDEKWRIVHEHWSSFNAEETIEESETLPGQASVRLH